MSASSELDVFVSYNSSDHATVEQIARGLKERALTVFLDRWELVPGRSWPDALEENLRRCRCAIIILGPSGMGPWQHRERHVALDRQARDDRFGVIPVILPGADPALGFLSLNTWVDMRGGTDDTRTLDLLAAAIRGQPPSALSEQSRQAISDVCPYRGLEVFREEDAPFFFGRDAFTERLVERIGACDLVAVVGASGSGKSSVVRAGLIPALRQGAGGIVWDLLTLTPGAEPLAALVRILDPPPDTGLIAARAHLNAGASRLRDGEVTLRQLAADLIARQPGTDRLLLVVDQFEELVTLAGDGKDQARFVDLLLEAAGEDAVLSVLLTLRSDFYTQLVARRDLNDRLQDAVVHIGPLSRTATSEGVLSELEMVIRSPAEAVGLDFEDGLVPRILADVGDEPGNLPLLEYLLTELWRRRARGQMTHEAYEALGGVQGAIARRAEEAYGQLAPDQQRAARRLFLSLVRSGEGRQDTRAAAPFPDDPLEAEVARRFAGPRLRLLVADEDLLRGRVVEVSHEALIRGWSRLRGWVDQNRETLRARDRMRQRMNRWSDMGEPEDLLLPPGLDLEEGRRLLETDSDVSIEEVRGYVTQSIAAEDARNAEREARREAERRRELAVQRQKRRLVQSALAVSLLLLALAGWQWWQADTQRRAAESARTEAEAARDEARQQAGIAERERRIAEQSVARFFATEASRLDAKEHGQLKVLLGIEAVRLDHTTRTDEALRSALSQRAWRPLAGHQGYVAAIALSSGGRRMASAGLDGTLRLWDLEDPKLPARVLARHQSALSAVAFGPRGEWLAAATSSGEVRLYDLAEPKHGQRLLSEDGSEVSTIAVSSNGRWLAAGGSDGRLRLWEVASSAAAPRHFEVARGPINEIALSPDGAWLAAGTKSGAVALWETDALDREPRLLDSHQEEVYGIAFSGDSRWLVSGGFEPRGQRAVSRWDLANLEAAPQPVVKTVGLGEQMYSVASVYVGAEGDAILTVGTDRAVRLLYPDEPDKHVLHSRFDSRMGSLAGVDGKWLATAGSDGLIWLLDLRGRGAEPRLHGDREGLVSAVALDSGGDRLVSGNADGSVRLHQVRRPSASTELLPNGSIQVSSIAWSPDDRWLAVGGKDGRLRLWDLAQPAAAPVPLAGHEQAVYPLRFSEDSRFLAAASGSGLLVHEVTAAASTPRRLPFNQSHVLALGFKDSNRLQAATSDNLVIAWDLRNPEHAIERRDLDGSPSNAAAFSPDARWLALSKSNREVQVFDLHEPQAEPRGLSIPFGGRTWSAFGYPVGFSPDGAWLAFVGGDNSIWLWDTHDWSRPPFALRGHSSFNAVSGIAFSQHSGWLASGGFDGLSRVWALPKELIRRACERSGRNLTAAEWRNYWGERNYRRSCRQWPLPQDLIREAAARFVRGDDSEAVLASLRAAWGDDSGAVSDIDEGHRNLLAAELVSSSINLSDRPDLLSGGSQIEQAIRYFQAAPRIAPGLELQTLGLGAEGWNGLCWRGAVAGFAAEVLQACDLAIETASPDRKGYYRDSRGVARARAGDLEGAVEDLEAFIAWAEGEHPGHDLIAKRRDWVTALRKGKDPFDPPTLQGMQSESF